MPKYSFPNTLIKNIIEILFVVGIVPFLFAQEQSSYIAGKQGYTEFRDIPEVKKGAVIFGKDAQRPLFQKQEELSELQSQARIYRSQGLELQRAGDLETAMSFYQKAIELDPAYAVAYNDLGVVYEARGLVERAEESYLKSIKVDPNYLSVYSNLALLYENKRQLDKASLYWSKRAELGSPDDPWTQKAKQRLRDINLSQGGLSESKEQEIIGLMKDIATQKSILRQDNKKLAKVYFEKAKLKFQKGDEVNALKEAINASQLDPSNTQIDEFIKKIQIRLLSK